MNVLLAAGLIGLTLAVLFALLVRRLASPARVRGVDPEWLRDFSVEVYRPMERLLSEDDYKFLKTQPGFEPSIGRQLRSMRRKIFRAYLRQLERDFRKLYQAAKQLLLYSPQDRPDLAVALLKQRALFSFGIAAVHVRLSLHTLGWGTVDVHGLVDSLDWLRAQTQQLVAAPSAA